MHRQPGDESTLSQQVGCISTLGVAPPSFTSLGLDLCPYWVLCQYLEHPVCLKLGEHCIVPFSHVLAPLQIHSSPQEAAFPITRIWVAAERDAPPPTTAAATSSTALAPPPSVPPSSFTRVTITDLRPEVLDLVRDSDCGASVCRDLAHLYHYYLHGPQGNTGASGGGGGGGAGGSAAARGGEASGSVDARGKGGLALLLVVVNAPGPHKSPA